MGLMGMKLCVLVIFLVLPWLAIVGDWALSWTEGNERVQVLFSMMLFPLIMNAMQYYIIDSYIKKKDDGHERIPTEEQSESEDSFDDALIISDEGSSSESDEEPKGKAKTNSKYRKGSRHRDGELQEYNPDTDGHSIHKPQSPQDSGKVLSPKLFPPE